MSSLLPIALRREERRDTFIAMVPACRGSLVLSVGDASVERHVMAAALRLAYGAVRGVQASTASPLAMWSYSRLSSFLVCLGLRSTEVPSLGMVKASLFGSCVASPPYVSHATDKAWHSPCPSLSGPAVPCLACRAAAVLVPGTAAWVSPTFAPRREAREAIGNSAGLQ